MMWIMLGMFHSMGQWNIYEVMLLYAMSLLSYGISGTFFYKMTTSFHKSIRDGTLDDALVQPIATLPYLICKNVLINYLPHIALSILIIAVCFKNLTITFSIPKILFFILSLFSGALIYSSMFLFVCIVTILTTKADSLLSVILMLREVSYYPLSIFPVILQFIMVCIVPYGLINFFPVQVLLNKTDFLMFSPIFQYIAPLLSIAIFIVTVTLFNYSLRFYKSSGS